MMQDVPKLQDSKGNFLSRMRTLHLRIRLDDVLKAFVPEAIVWGWPISIQLLRPTLARLIKPWAAETNLGCFRRLDFLRKESKRCSFARKPVATSCLPKQSTSANVSCQSFTCNPVNVTPVRRLVYEDLASNSAGSYFVYCIWICQLNVHANSSKKMIK